MIKVLVLMPVLFVFAIIFGVLGFCLGYEGAITWGGIVTSLGTLFGGLLSLGGVVITGAVLASVFMAVLYLADKNHNVWAALVALVAFVVASFGWSRYVNLPDGRLWLFVGLFVLVAIETLVVSGALTGFIRSRRAARPVGASASAATA